MRPPPPPLRLRLPLVALLQFTHQLTRRALVPVLLQDLGWSHGDPGGVFPSIHSAGKITDDITEPVLLRSNLFAHGPQCVLLVLLPTWQRRHTGASTDNPTCAHSLCRYISVVHVLKCRIICRRTRMSLLTRVYGRMLINSTRYGSIRSQSGWCSLLYR